MAAAWHFKSLSGRSRAWSHSEVTRSEKTFTTRAAGTGLGLAIVHRIIDAHAGRIQVRNNTDGPGATFEIFLPSSHQTESHTLAAALAGPESSR